MLAETFVPDHSDPDKRYNPNDPAGLVHKVFGTYYFTMWQAAGHHNETPVLGAKMRGSGTKFNAAAVFLKHTAPLMKSVSMIFQAVDPWACRSYLSIFHYNLGITALDTLQTSLRACYMGIAINRNNRVLPHKDVKDFKDGWAVMCCF